MSSAALALFWPTAHFVLVLLLILGALFGVRRTWVARVHVVAALATGAVFLAGADCPLTVWEKAARADAGWSVYEGGFIEHYLVRPVSPAGITPIVSVAIVAIWLVPSLLGHGLR